MADDITSNNSNFAEILNDIISNKELMAKINESIGTPPPTTATNNSDNSQTEQNIGNILSGTDIMTKLPEVINLIKPLMSSEKSESKQQPSLDKRLGLLIALKPYLSPKRCEAIDYIVRISKLSETVKGLKL